MALLDSSRYRDPRYKSLWHNEGQLGPRVDDDRRPASPENIGSASTRYRYDYDELQIEFDADARIANERIGYIFQMRHAWEEGTTVGPHLHWMQNAAAVPNWWMKYRAYNNGESPPAWTELIAEAPSFTYTSGTILQISPFPDIELPDLRISGFIDIVFGRDTGNVSTLFAGADPLAATALFKEFDLHVVIDSSGSKEDFVK